MKQLELQLPMHGGLREGAGRKRGTARPTVPHVERAAFVPRHPVQVTWRCVGGLPSLRGDVPFSVILGAFAVVRARVGFRLVHYAVLANHIHAIVEADSAEAFELGMRSLGTLLAKRLNALFQRKGRFFDHRFHMRVLASPSEVRWSLQYVLLNARKHAAERGVRMAASWLDPRSSAAVFDGWLGDLERSGEAMPVTSAPATWLLAVGWRRAGGPLRADAVPSAA